MTRDPRKIQCPTCHRLFEPDMSAICMPFCSERCKLADLYRWLDEDIGLPVYPSTDDEEDQPEPPPAPVRREWTFE